MKEICCSTGISWVVSDRNKNQVFAPTTPSAVRLRDFWNLITSALVLEPSLITGFEADHAWLSSAIAIFVGQVISTLKIEKYFTK